jgi:hypothetical protein
LPPSRNARLARSVSTPCLAADEAGQGVAELAVVGREPVAQELQMPTSLTEFDEETAFERYVLDRATPLLPRSQGTSVIELDEFNSVGVAIGVQPATVHVGMTNSAGSAEDQLSADDIQPLLFGAAWKVLNQLIELALEQAGIPHDRRWDYSIKLKVREAANRSVTPVMPFEGRLDLWLRVITTYASTDVLRNSLTHRRLIVDPATVSYLSPQGS